MPSPVSGSLNRPAAALEPDGDQRRGADLPNILVILAACSAFAYLRWLKLDTLVWGDPARWIFDAGRVADGGVPYRDFAWPYPPLSVLLQGWTERLFGATFIVTQSFIDVISLAVVILGYLLVRQILPRWLHLPSMFLLLVVCATSQTYFGLFTFLTYVPALQIAAAGCLLLLLGMLDYLRGGQLNPRSWAAMTLGAFLAIFSKPEGLVASYSALALLALGDRTLWFAGRSASEWIWHYAKLFLACTLPAVAAYVATGAWTGFGNMFAGMSGYGLASSSCPWWPTGLGVFGGIASLGEAAFIAAILSLTRYRQFRARFGKQYSRWLAIAASGALVYATYVAYLNWSVLTSGVSILEKVKSVVPSVLWTTPVLLPVMWTSIVWWLYLVFRALFGRERPTAGSIQTLLVLTMPVVMSTRGLFDATIQDTTQVSAICNPFFLLLAPFLMWRWLQQGGAGGDLEPGIRAWPGASVAGLILLYALARLGGTYSTLLSDAPYRTLSTAAGNIRLSEYDTNAEIYRFVTENTVASDTILDIPHGGGINFASRHASPIFSTQFQHLSITAEYLAQDLEGVRTRPPRVVIAQDLPNLGASYGLDGYRCPAPQLVWRPPHNDVDRDWKFPALEFIKQNYRIAKKVGSRILLVPK